MKKSGGQCILLILDVNWLSWYPSIVYEGCGSSNSTLTSVTPVESADAGCGADASRSKSFLELHLHEMIQSVVHFVRICEYAARLTQVTILAMNGQECRIISKGRIRNQYVTATSGKNYIKEMVHSIFEFASEGAKASNDSMLAGALSTSLCYINRIQKQKLGGSCRILILDASTLHSYGPQYMSIMNSAFTASKQGTLIDTCSLSPMPCTILEQLCDITGGCYVSFAKSLVGATVLRMSMALSNLLMFYFFLDQQDRSLVSISRLQNRANTAVCFCHHKTVEMCAICSCCLTIYCSGNDESGKDRAYCQICGARFTRYTVQQKSASSIL